MVNLLHCVKVPPHNIVLCTRPSSVQLNIQCSRLHTTLVASGLARLTLQFSLHSSLQSN